MHGAGICDFSHNSETIFLEPGRRTTSAGRRTLFAARFSHHTGQARNVGHEQSAALALDQPELA